MENVIAQINKTFPDDGLLPIYISPQRGTSQYSTITFGAMGDRYSSYRNFDVIYTTFCEFQISFLLKSRDPKRLPYICYLCYVVVNAKKSIAAFMNTCSKFGYRGIRLLL